MRNQRSSIKFNFEFDNFVFQMLLKWNKFDLVTLYFEEKLMGSDNAGLQAYSLKFLGRDYS